MPSLILKRRFGQRVIITTRAGERIEIEMMGVVQGGHVHRQGTASLRFTAPADVLIDREEVAIRREHPRPAGATDSSATAAPTAGSAGSGGTQ